MRECLKKEVIYRTSRSSGPGGQHVNKTESRVELVWNPGETGCLDNRQLELVRNFLGARLTDRGLLILSSEKYRSQYMNREEVTERFLALITRGLVPRKPRHPTRPTRASREERIRQKKIRGEIKRHRGYRPPGE